MISSLKPGGAAPEHRRLKGKGTLQNGTKIQGTGTFTPQTGTMTQKTEKIGTGKSLYKPLILSSTNPQYDKRLFIDLAVLT